MELFAMTTAEIGVLISLGAVFVGTAAYLWWSRNKLANQDKEILKLYIAATKGDLSSFKRLITALYRSQKRMILVQYISELLAYSAFREPLLRNPSYQEKLIKLLIKIYRSKKFNEEIQKDQKINVPEVRYIIFNTLTSFPSKTAYQFLVEENARGISGNIKETALIINQASERNPEFASYRAKKFASDKVKIRSWHVVSINAQTLYDTKLTLQETKSLGKAVKRNKGIIFDLSPISNLPPEESYQHLVMLFFVIASDIDHALHSHIQYMVREALKNAFFHGNQLDFEKQIILKIDYDDQSRNISGVHVFDEANTKEADSRLRELAKSGDLSGNHAFVVRINGDKNWQYVLDQRKGLGSHAAFLKVSPIRSEARFNNFEQGEFNQKRAPVLAAQRKQAARAEARAVSDMPDYFFSKEFQAALFRSKLFLNEEQKELLHAIYFEKLSQRKIAQRLGVKDTTTVDQRLKASVREVKRFHGVYTVSGWKTDRIDRKHLNEESVWKIGHLSRKTKDIFEEAGIKTIADLLGKTEQDLLALPRFGEVSFNEIQAQLTKRRLPKIKKAAPQAPEALYLDSATERAINDVRQTSERPWKRFPFYPSGQEGGSQTVYQKELERLKTHFDQLLEYQQTGQWTKLKTQTVKSNPRRIAERTFYGQVMQVEWIDSNEQTQFRVKLNVFNGFKKLTGNEIAITVSTEAVSGAYSINAILPYRRRSEARIAAKRELLEELNRTLPIDDLVNNGALNGEIARQKITEVLRQIKLNGVTADQIPELVEWLATQKIKDFYASEKTRFTNLKGTIRIDLNDDLETLEEFARTALALTILNPGLTIEINHTGNLKQKLNKLVTEIRNREFLADKNSTNRIRINPSVFSTPDVAVGAEGRVIFDDQFFIDGKRVLNRTPEAVLLTAASLLKDIPDAHGIRKGPDNQHRWENEASLNAFSDQRILTITQAQESFQAFARAA
jgi:polyhydroxyalkanoate synthesis regulator phasin